MSEGKTEDLAATIDLLHKQINSLEQDKADDRIKAGYEKAFKEQEFRTSMTAMLDKLTEYINGYPQETLTELKQLKDDLQELKTQNCDKYDELLTKYDLATTELAEMKRQHIPTWVTKVFGAILAASVTSIPALIFVWIKMSNLLDYMPQLIQLLEGLP